MQDFKVLYDGWPLVNAPNSASAIHLRTLLLFAPDNIHRILALPGPSNLDGVDDEIEIVTKEEKGLGAWQQKQLPRILKSSGGQIIHACIDGAALLGRHITVVSPAGQHSSKPGNRRRSSALGKGGMVRAEILWPADIDPNAAYGNQHFLPPIAHPDFFGEEDEINPNLNIPETFILHHGATDDKSMRDLLEAWTWAAASVGEYFPLLLLGLPTERKKWVEAQARQFNLGSYVQVLPEIPWRDLSVLYRNCSAVIAIGEDESWGASARLALAAGKSIVGFNSGAKEKLIGNAAYLVDEGELRALGAAMISVLVNENISEKLEETAQKRSARWDPIVFSKALKDFYEGMV